MKMLEDYIGRDLNILSIGLNPSTVSVEKEFYFANPRNRFWKAFNASGLVPEELDPSKQAQEILFQRYKIGFTDVVKRHSSMGKDLVAADYRKYAPILEAKIIKYQPKISWFHGKIAANKFLQYSNLKESKVVWGLQEFKIGQSKIFVTPNPSPANAAYSLEVLIEWYKKICTLDCEIDN
ncbi:MAG: mismatch-specific DNA-glycosylase [Gammaproteobacteria bacterium]